MLGEKIKYLRKRKNITQAELGKAIGMTQSAIGMIEGNKNGASIDKISRIADYFDVGMEYLLDDSNKKTFHTDCLLDNSEKDTGLALYYKPVVKKDTPKYFSNNKYTVPTHFKDPTEARQYINKHQIFGASGLNTDTLSDKEVLEFANELLNQMELVSYKYKK